MTDNLISKCLLCSDEKIYKKLKIKDRIYYKCKNLNIKQHSLALIEPENNQNHNLFQRTKSILLS